MKNLFIFYLVTIFIPIPILIWFALNEMNDLFVISLLVYALLYRPIFDYLRLKGKVKADNNNMWKFFIPFWSLKWFKSLYLNK